MVGDGFDPSFMPSELFDFQKALVEWASTRARCAVLADCGLGKSGMQLTWAQNIVERENGRVLDLTPLAVGAQMVREGAKFGIEVTRSRDGRNLPKSGVIVTNYEQLDKFDPNDFVGVVCDECFVPGTLVETERDGKRFNVSIEDIRCGDVILNAAGRDTVRAVARREKHAVVRVVVEGTVYYCSLNHPWFTCMGWKVARDLRTGDRIVATRTAVRLVREAVQSEVRGFVSSAFLRDELLREMADGCAGAQGEGAQFGGSCEARPIGVTLASRNLGRASEVCEVLRFGAHTRGARKDGEVQEGTIYSESWRQRCGDDGTTGVSVVGATSILEGGSFRLFERCRERLSNQLQARFSCVEPTDRYRIGRSFAPLSEGARREEGGEISGVRVDGIEVLELGHPELERFRDADGKLYLYDIEATRHPSFSVGGLLVHNSSCLKNFDGVRRGEITRFLSKMRYRLLCTATSAPNDYIELGTHSEALGELGYVDVLGRFFVTEDGRGSAAKRGWGEAVKFRLKGHAEEPFWRWVCSWARAVRKPSDLGFDDGRFVLPPLVENTHLVEARNIPKGMLFEVRAGGLQAQREAGRRTLRERCEKVAQLCAEHPMSLIWCNLNDEGNLLEEVIDGAVQVSGSDPDEKKEERLLAFAEGQIKRLVTKPRIGGWGLNFQRCAHVSLFPSHSFEQYYQGVRRCWRFGQEFPVTVDLVGTEGLSGIIDNLRRKAVAADKMFDQIVGSMNQSMAVREVRSVQGMEVPAWMM